MTVVERRAGDLESMARGVRRAQQSLGRMGEEGAVRRSGVLRRLAALLEERREEILRANQQDLEAAREAELKAALYGRLELTAEKLATLREGVEQLAAQPDLIGSPVRRTELAEGMVLRQVRSPLGVLLIIFESRPDAVIQIGSLALRSGNGVILKGGSEALHSNRALVACLQQALELEGLPSEAVLGIEGREAVAELLTLDDVVDLVIPRGSAELVRSIQSSTRIPVLGHADGLCHLFLDASADPAMALHVTLDSKCGYPSACNAIETLLVHRDFLTHLEPIGRALAEAGVELRADERALPHLAGAAPATEEDWSTEYCDLILSVRTVEGLDEALEHIRRYGSAHTEAIVTADETSRQRFLEEVDAASVFVNASTRFADGYRYGLGAEVGISTGRIHARGPVGVEGLLTTRWLLEGQGESADDFGPGRRSFTHRPLPIDG